jgi:peptide/nickel transport system permease protein
VLVFGLVHLAPFDPARYFVQFRQGAREEQIRQLRQWYGLDDPVPVQYLRWVRRVATGDFGRSVSSGRELGPELWRRLPWTLLLLAVAWGLAAPAAVGLALAGARGGAGGAVARPVGTGAALVPVFLLASVLVYVFAVRLAWVPILPPFELRLLDPALWRALLVPAVSLAVPVAALAGRQLAAALREGLAAPYARTARARGVPAAAVRRDALRAAAAVVLARPLSLVVASLGALLVVEEVVGWPGLGRVFMRAVAQRDITAVQAALFLLVAVGLAGEVAARQLAVHLAGGDPAGAGGSAAVREAAGRPPTAAARPAPVPALDGSARAAAIVLAGLVAAALAAPVLARFPPDLVLLEEIQLPPSARHWMGTDASGRDLFSRLLYAGRVTMALAAVPAVVAVAGAVVLAGVARWRGPVWEAALAGSSRTLGAFPPLALAMAVAVVVGRIPTALGGVMVAWGLAECLDRVVTLTARARAWPFAEAAVALGATPGRVLERHLGPHLARPLAAEALALVPGFVLLEATLGFFGFSLSPTVPTWGTLLWRGREALHRGDWWLLAFPVAFALATAWACLRLAETLRTPDGPTYVRVVRPGRGPEWAPAAARGTTRPAGRLGVPGDATAVSAADDPPLPAPLSSRSTAASRRWWRRGTIP